ncbi:uncharacterized protein DNG_01165 [Cephalotrichum gorgonifer]|uniref:LPXTG-domain-containing protein n=1 Tax=Cephalotrichum gorgonifer TaxID=2041049 RepID=A0AAE8MQP4_9PEZI|nr:uncharacterized protein DNG_01165 [Cephalotrichum gorgonifer]
MASFRITSTFYLALLILIPSLFHSALGIQVTPGSPCAAICMDEEDGDPFSPDSSTTNATDIVCQDSLYKNSAEGIKFKSCLECLQKSDKTNGTESDINWLLYNLRYSLGTCLYGFEDEAKTISSPCVISWACEPLQDAILAGNLEPDTSDAFGYCAAGNGSLFGNTLKACVDCLKASDDESYLGNFMVALQVGCAQEPEPGTILGIGGSPFTRENLQVSTGSDDEKDTDPGASANSLTTGAIVGIAVGAALLVFGGAALYFVYRRKKNRSSGRSSSADLIDRDPNSRSRSPPPVSGPGMPWMGHGAGGRSAASSRAEGRDEDEKEPRRVIGGSQHARNYSYNAPGHDRSLSGNLSAMPAHPAYRPPQSDRSNTPTPPLSQRHRNPFENRSTSSITSLSQTPTPPRGPSPAAQPPRQRPPPEAPSLQGDFVLPPPPPPAAKVPSVAVPSPRARAPKKYIPPSIVIEPPMESSSPRFVRVGA